ncbi:MAG TPA: four-carbon acid sugar kinase family protein [Edaphobacter sp.]|nr:four-carbon acid sugar kinase family protein [Edaphobacter sp.]
MLYTFYGDDFTGSTDVLEQLASNHVPAVLFLGSPSPRHLANFPHAQAIGIAGDSRSRSPQWMTENLPALFTTLKSFNAPINHYKVCSTFDSAPHIGSIGRAMEIGKEVFAPTFIPIVVAAPHLRRYVIFGNLFAEALNGEVLRIDLHPMAHHPVTPMREANLRLHLRSQTQLPIGLVDLLALRSGAAAGTLDDQLAAGSQAILFDGLDPHGPHQPTLTATGDLLWQRAQQSPLFSASSSGLTAALIPAWRSVGLIPATTPAPKHLQSPAPLLVVSGSCSVVTAGQIQWALAHGFHGIAIDTARLLDPNTAAAERAHSLSAASASLASGQSTILYTALGPPAGTAQGDNLGIALGHLLRELLLATPTRRVLLCGGDTSSHATQQLGLYALTWSSRVQTGAPLCRASSDDPTLDGLELVLKGGQVGTADFFHAVHLA